MKSTENDKCHAKCYQNVKLKMGGYKAQRHRRFVGFLTELDAEFSNLPLYTSIRWFSAGKILKQFFGLRKEILLFLKNN